MRVLSKTQHGIVDYVTAVTELALAVFLPAGPVARGMLGFSGLNAAVVGALTDSPTALMRLI